MGRWWLFNPYDKVENLTTFRWTFKVFRKQFTIGLPFYCRIHYIATKDFDRALHDHPWDARTIILKGWYVEQRREGSIIRIARRNTGSTAVIRHDDFHRITELSEGGVYTLFISSDWRHVWGFLVNGVKVPWREYLGITDEDSFGEPDRRRDVDDPKLLKAERALAEWRRANGLED